MDYDDFEHDLQSLFEELRFNPDEENTKLRISSLLSSDFPEEVDLDKILPKYTSSIDVIIPKLGETPAEEYYIRKMLFRMKNETKEEDSLWAKDILSKYYGLK